MSGLGTYVNNSDDHVRSSGAGYVGGTNLIIEKFNQTFNLSEIMKEEVDNYLSTLNDTLNNITTPTDIESLYGTVTINDITPIDLNAIPEVGTISLEGFDDVIFPLKPILKTAPDIDLSYDTPSKPTEVNPSINFVEAAYNSDVWLALYTAVYDGLVNGGTGLSADVEDAIYARQAERNRVANEQAYRKALNAAAANGFDFPTEVAIAIEQEMAAEILRQNINTSNEIAISQAQLAQTNTHFILDKGVSLEEILRNFHNLKENRSLEADKAAADLILRNYAEKVRMYIADWEGIKTSLQAKISSIEAIINENRIFIESYKAEIDGAIAQTEQIAKERESIVEAYKGEVQAYSAKVNAQVAMYSALTEQQKAQLQKSELELRKVTDQLKLQLDSLVSVNSLKEKIVEAMANIATQVLASSLTAVATTIGHTTRSSEGINESYTHSDGISEQHYFDETKV